MKNWIKFYTEQAIAILEPLDGPPLTLDEFLKINKSEFNVMIERGDCICSLHNTFCSFRRKGLFFNIEDLLKLYELCKGIHAHCEDLKNAISMLAESEESRVKFLQNCNYKKNANLN